MMRSQMDCREIERIVWTEGPEAAPQSHLQECVSCREEARRAADLGAALSGLRMQLATAPPDLYEAILDSARRTRLLRAREVVTHPKFLRGAAVGAAAAATAAVGVLVARRLSSRTAPAPAPSLVA